jgi:hypothetical protein
MNAKEIVSEIVSENGPVTITVDPKFGSISIVGVQRPLTAEDREWIEGAGSWDVFSPDDKVAIVDIQSVSGEVNPELEDEEPVTFDNLTMGWEGEVVLVSSTTRNTSPEQRESNAQIVVYFKTILKQAGFQSQSKVT